MQKFFIAIVFFLATNISFGQDKSANTTGVYSGSDNQGGISIVDPDEKDPDLEDDKGQKSRTIKIKNKGEKSIVIYSVSYYFKRFIHTKIYRDFSNTVK